MIKKKREKNFNKTLLQSYIISRCERRLFLGLCKNKPDLWVKPLRDTIKPKRIPTTSDLLKELGKDYELNVYSRLRHVKNVEYREKESKIDNLKLTPIEFEKFFKFLQDNPREDILLLEFEYKIPSFFFHNLFPTKQHKNEIPVDYGKQRPDLVIIGNTINTYVPEVFELLANGNFQKIPQNEINNRYGISIFDIKKTPKERIGKKHFVEVFYYMWTLAHYIKANNLDSKFYVRANFNGIFPEQEECILDLISDIPSIINKKLVTPINWEESRRIFFQLAKRIKDLWVNSPCAIDSIPLNLHQGCGYCQYIEDCKNTLNCNEHIDPSKWSLRLIPFTSHSIAEQLINDYNFDTIGDVVQNIDTVKVGNIPKPLYSELPLLKLKAKALAQNQIIYPGFDQTHSYAIPRYSHIALTFGVEYDANNEKVFVFGLYLKMFVTPGVRYYTKFSKWWKIWRIALEKSLSPTEICFELNKFLIQEIPLEMVKRVLQYLTQLKGIDIFLKGDKNRAGVEVVYKYSDINEGLSKENEAKIVKQMIFQLYIILEVCTIIEDYVFNEDDDGKRVFRLNTSLFYWGQNQLRHFEELIERNLDFIVDDDDTREYYERILLYFRPSDTEVANPYQHKKIFDIQKFAESFVGVPNIINYTWHSIAEKLFPYRFKSKFWIPHFNFLDLNNWLRYLSPNLALEKRSKIGLEIQEQQILKLNMVDQIRSSFQRKGNIAISVNARPISRAKYRSVILPSEYHAIAHVWYIFSMRTSTLQQQEAEFYRTMFPEYSIGKMAAAEVSDLRMTYYGEKKVIYKFNTVGLSSNMKLKEGERVLLIPKSKRDLNPNLEMYKWSIIIKKITWNSDINGNTIETEETTIDVFEMCKRENLLNPKQWFIYPLKFDPWSHKLYKPSKKGLFQRKNFGKSWLGHRLSYLWKIRTNPELYWPAKWEFTSPAIYLFTPELLFNFKNPSLEKNLITPIYPKPDISQIDAIKNSLQNTISAILGPPGTGKSQTIAALIDEYLCRRKKEGNLTTKILITSFSYAALRVVIEKIRESRDINDKPTISSQTQLIFLRSESKSPIEANSGCKDVDDLVRRQGGSWRWNNQTHMVTNTHLLEEQLENNTIIFANAHQLFHLPERVDDDFAFDLICVDEASQLPVDHFMSSLQFIHKSKLKIAALVNKGSIGSKITDLSKIEKITLDRINSEIKLSKIVIVGDHNQLPPVRSISPPKKLEPILSSLFSYYIAGHKIPSKQLKINYRSHNHIVEFTSSLGFYKDLIAHENNANRLLEGDINRVDEAWLKIVLAPKRVVSSIQHSTRFDIGISMLEAEIVKKIIIGYYKMVNPVNKLEETRFWTKQVGVVAPHNAQGKTIINKLFQELETITHLNKEVLMTYLKNTVYSVEKFQGSDRDMIVSSIGLSDVDKISDEVDFIFDINRFNVLTSRAKSKLIFIASREILEYIPDDIKIIEHSSKFNLYVNKICNKQFNLKIKDGKNKSHKITYRYKQ